MCKCGTNRILNIGAKCSDLCFASFGELEHVGYVPNIEGIGGGDYVEIGVCMDCGTLRGFKTLTDAEIKEAFEEA